MAPVLLVAACSCRISDASLPAGCIFPLSHHYKLPEYYMLSTGVQAFGAGIITLSGWVAAAALAAMGMVVVIGLYAGIHRLLSPSRPYTVIRELRDGDA